MLPKINRHLFKKQVKMLYNMDPPKTPEEKELWDGFVNWLDHMVDAYYEKKDTNEYPSIQAD